MKPEEGNLSKVPAKNTALWKKKKAVLRDPSPSTYETLINLLILLPAISI